MLTEAKYKGNAADVWSLGVMLYVMIEGAFPFRLRRQRYQMQKMIGRIINAEYKRPMHVSLCMCASTLMFGCAAAALSTHPSMSHLSAALAPSIHIQRGHVTILLPPAILLHAYCAWNGLQCAATSIAVGSRSYVLLRRHHAECVTQGVKCSTPRGDLTQPRAPCRHR